MRISESHREVMDWCRDKLERLLEVGKLDKWDAGTVRAVIHALDDYNPLLREGGHASESSGQEAKEEPVDAPLEAGGSN